jgi:beta-lactamase superfamily II metal-dependent hydrolase
MANVWANKVEAAHLVPGSGVGGQNKTPKPHKKKVPQLPATVTRARLEALAAKKETDGSEANGSSIAFVLEYDKKRLLLGADAHPDVLAENLARYGTMVGEGRPRIDLFKMAHHGSGANMSAACLQAIDCRRYMLSSNGDNFGHPDDTAIARAILGSTGPTKFYCNYATERTSPWVERGQPIGATFIVPRDGQQGKRVAV